MNIHGVVANLQSRDYVLAICERKKLGQRSLKLLRQDKDLFHELVKTKQLTLFEAHLV